MRQTLSVTAFASAMIAMVACSRSERAPEQSQPASPAAAAASAGSPAPAAPPPDRAPASTTASRHACDVLTPSRVQEALRVASLEAKETRRSAATYTACTLVWPSDKKVEREIAGRKMTVDAENRITLSLSVVPPGREQAVFEAGTRRLRQRYDVEPVQGVGAEAVWIPKMNQLSVRGSGQVFHLSVDHPDGAGDNLEHAKRLAAELLAELG